MNSYGIHQAASYGNSSDNFNRINQVIRETNARQRLGKINDITTAVSNNKSTDPLLRQTEDASKTGLGVAVIDTDKVRAVAKSGKILVQKGAPLALDAMDSFDRAVLQPKGGSVMNSVMNMSKSDRAAEAVGQTTESIGDTLRAGAGASKAGATTAGKVLGGAASVLNIGLGAVDAIQDISSGKIEGQNKLERDSNIEQIGAAALETAGLTLDSSIIGVPAGVALNVAGAALGLISGISELVGKSREKSTAEDAVTAAKAEPVVTLKPLAIPDSSSSGQDVIRSVQKNVGSSGGSVY